MYQLLNHHILVVTYSQTLSATETKEANVVYSSHASKSNIVSVIALGGKVVLLHMMVSVGHR